MATPPAHPRTPKPKATAKPKAAPPPARPPQTPLYMGIDLGTSRSSVVASNGARHVIESYVGWPVDAIARRVVNQPFLIGREALDNRLMLDLHRPLEAGYIKEGSDKDIEAVQELLRHLLTLAGVEYANAARPRVHAVIGVPARAMAGQQQHLRNAVQGIVDQVLIVPEPFAVAYGLGALLHTMIIDIGAGTTDFCVLHGRYPTEEERETLSVAGGHDRRRTGQTGARALSGCAVFAPNGTRLERSREFCGRGRGARHRHRSNPWAPDASGYYRGDAARL